MRGQRYLTIASVHPHHSRTTHCLQAHYEFSVWSGETYIYILFYESYCIRIPSRLDVIPYILQPTGPNPRDNVRQKVEGMSAATSPNREQLILKPLNRVNHSDKASYDSGTACLSTAGQRSSHMVLQLDDNRPELIRDPQCASWATRGGRPNMHVRLMVVLSIERHRSFYQGLAGQPVAACGFSVRHWMAYIPLM